MNRSLYFESAIYGHRSKRRWVWIVAIAGALCSLPRPAAVAQEAIDGRQLYEEACAGCHGRNGQETARGQARRLDSLSAGDIHDYLTAARAIEAPARPYQRLKKGLGDAEIEALADYIGQFPGH
ncbi:c-type cytochrome [Pseudochelatococcus sp. B33]